jgi:hypothetical protein
MFSARRVLHVWIPPAADTSLWDGKLPVLIELDDPLFVYRDICAKTEFLPMVV